MNASRRKAIRIYRSFREANPQKIAVFDVDVPSDVAAIGHLEACDYRTTHAGKLTLYRHEFIDGSRPLLCASADGRSLWLLGGRFKFTDRGIVDLDAKGRELENKKHGHAI